MNNKIYLSRSTRWTIFALACIFLAPGIMMANLVPGSFTGSPPPSISCPANIIQGNDPGVCSAVVIYTPPPNSTLIAGLPSGSVFPLGTTTNIFQENGGTDTCSFTVTVLDTEAPVIVCPENIYRSYDAGLCQAVFYDTPVASDHCSSPTVFQTAGLPSGSVFPAGMTVNTFKATDGAGNTSLCSFTVTIGSGHLTVLPGDGSFSGDQAPQGALRYQRELYLVLADEMKASGLANGMAVSSIGFTIGAAQDDTTRGHLKVYLQNTTDIQSRTDTAWTMASSSTNSYLAASLLPGTYEWEVKANCSGSSGYTYPVSFSNDDLTGCNQPYDLVTDPIGQNSATFHWESYSSAVFTGYEVEYRVGGSATWQSAITTDTFYVATGLLADTGYQWQVRTICSGDDSELAAASFRTIAPDNCNEPSGLSAGTITDTSAVISWTATSGATIYEVRYRRYGTSNWFTTISPSSTFTLTGLTAGTRYEWNVRTICSSGSGVYVSGSPFTTTGGTVCYVPSDPLTKAIISSSATFTWLPVPGASSYTIRYRLRESISWSHAIGPMMLVYDSLVTIPDSIGPYEVPLPQVTPFTYTGEGIYIAWEFSRPSGGLTLPNRSLCTRRNSTIKGSNGIDSLKVILCLTGKSEASTTILPSTLSATSYRPETRLGSPGLKDSVAVAAVYGFGRMAFPYGNPSKIKALIKNFTGSSKTWPVTLEVKDQGTGAVRHTQTINVTVPASCSTIAAFTGWSPQIRETDSVIVTVPAQAGENVLDNNRNYFLQKVNSSVLAYADETDPISGAGHGTAGGLILARYTMNGCGKVNAAQVYLHSSAKGHAIHAVILSQAGTILDSSAVFTPDSTDINNYYSFFFPNTPLITNDAYFIGLAQPADPVNGYYPVGLQWENMVIRDSAYYGATLGGSNMDDHVFPGKLMIRAEVIPGMPVPEVSGNLTLCAGDTNTLKAAARNTRFANQVVSYSSQDDNTRYRARQVLGTPDVYPADGAAPGVWLSSSPDGQRENLVLGFPSPAQVDFVDIYEILSPGAVDTVYVKNTSGSFVAVWSDTAKAEPQAARINHIVFPRTLYAVSEIRLALNSPLVPGYNAIDAVGIGTFDDPATFSTYLWTPGGQTTQSVQVSSPGTYTLGVTSPGGCQGSASADVITPVTVTPVITAGGPTTFCQGDSVVLTSSIAEGNSWSNGATTQSITVKTSGSYTVTVNNGCNSTTSAATAVTVNPLPAVTITGGSICPGSSATLDAGAGYSSYLWSTGATTQTISVNTPGLYTVTVTDGNGCKASANQFAIYAPAPVPSISGDPNFCPGDSTILDAGGGYSAYLWSTGATTQSITVKSLGTFSVTVTNSFGCTSSTSVTTHHYPVPVPTISGTFSLCAGTTTVLDAGTGYASYLWSTGETTHFIVVDTAATFTVTVTDFNGCHGSASATTTQDGSMPATPGPISGPTTGVCNASNLVYSIATVPNTTHYVWTVPPGMTITSGQGMTSITVSVGNITSGIITVAASNACGQSPSWTPSNLTIYGTPSDPGTITGQSSAVCGMANVPYSISPVPGATSYTWTAPAGASIASGQGTPMVTISYGGTFSSGNICVISVSSCGSSNPSCLAVTGRPQMPAVITGPAEVCKKQKNVSYSVPPVSGATSYTWTVPPQAVIASGQGTSGILVNFGTQSGQVTATASNSCGSSNPQVLQVTVKTCGKGGDDILAGDSTTIYPGWNNGSSSFIGSYGTSLQPEVISTSGDFFPGTHATLSWTLGEPMIETFGEDLGLLTQGFQQAGYQVVAINDQQGDPGYTIELYPVPTTDYVNIVVHATENPVSLRLELYDMTGKMVYSRNIETETVIEKLELTRYPTGMFMLKVTNLLDPDIRTFKIVKCR